jgi:hypothetical protein
MPNPIIRIHDLVTGEVTDRPMTAAEMEQAETEKLAYVAIEADRQAKATARQAVLDRLGLTEDEAALLLGGN